jgi:hypothetical protein
LSGALILFFAFLGLLLVIQPAQAAGPRAALAHQGMSQQIAFDLAEAEAIRTATTVTVTTFILSNEAPGYLVDHLISLGHGDETLLQVLGYLKAQSWGVISDDFYNQVAGAPPGSEVFTASLNNYAGLDGGIEIAADGTLYIPNVEGGDYINNSNYETRNSQDWQFYLTNARNGDHYIYTHTKNYGGGIIKDYYAFGIA